MPDELTISDDRWVATGNEELPGGAEALLVAPIRINDTFFHLEAWQVEVVDSIQQALQRDEELGLIYNAVGANGHWDTVTIREREYVLVATPFC